MNPEKVKIYYQVETENIENILRILKEYQTGKKHQINNIELAGMAVYLHNFYNGIENILKRVLEYHGVKIKDSSFWHKKLLQTAQKNKIISGKLYNYLLDYLSFRHYFVHGYAFKLEYQKMEKLFTNVLMVYNLFKRQIIKKIK